MDAAPAPDGKGRPERERTDPVLLLFYVVEIDVDGWDFEQRVEVALLSTWKKERTKGEPPR